MWVFISSVPLPTKHIQRKIRKRSAKVFHDLSKPVRRFSVLEPHIAFCLSSVHTSVTVVIFFIMPLNSSRSANQESHHRDKHIPSWAINTVSWRIYSEQFRQTARNSWQSWLHDGYISWWYRAKELIRRSHKYWSIYGKREYSAIIGPQKQERLVTVMVFPSISSSRASCYLPLQLDHPDFLPIILWIYQFKCNHISIYSLVQQVRWESSFNRFITLLATA